MHENSENDEKQEKSSTGGVSVSISGTVEGSTVIAAGRDASLNQVVTHQGLSGEDVAKLFTEIYGRLDTLPMESGVETESVRATIEKLETEAKKGDNADATRIEHWLERLADMAPDILEIVLTTLTNPAAGIAEVVRRAAEKARKSLLGSR